jgi:DNA-binding GntR family transcriptional regulator
MRGEEERGVSAAEAAYLAIRGDILDGILAAEERVTETGLAERLGLSRTPVREAIRRLLIEGFLRRAPGEGLRVTGLSPDEVQQIFRIRAMLESYGARRAAEHATAADCAELRRLAEVMSAHTPPRSRADTEAISLANAAFHNRIMVAARSPRLAGMLSLAVNIGLVLRTYQMYSAQDMIRQSRHHHDIAEAIAARDPDWAEAAMTAHVLAAAGVARRVAAGKAGEDGAAGQWRGGEPGGGAGASSGSSSVGIA